LTTGIVITTIGITLIKVGMTDLAGGYGYADFGSPENLLLGISVLFIVIVFNASKYLCLDVCHIYWNVEWQCNSVVVRFN